MKHQIGWGKWFIFIFPCWVLFHQCFQKFSLTHLFIYLPEQTNLGNSIVIFVKILSEIPAMKNRVKNLFTECSRSRRVVLLQFEQACPHWSDTISVRCWDVEIINATSQLILLYRFKLLPSGRRPYYSYRRSVTVIGTDIGKRFRLKRDLNKQMSISSKLKVSAAKGDWRWCRQAAADSCNSGFH